MLRIRHWTLTQYCLEGDDVEGQVQEEIDDILSRYPVKRSALIPLLYLAQREQGYVTESAMKEIAGICSN